jgi:hypothetical protein
MSTYTLTVLHYNRVAALVMTVFMLEYVISRIFRKIITLARLTRLILTMIICPFHYSVLYVFLYIYAESIKFIDNIRDGTTSDVRISVKIPKIPHSD